MAKFGIDIWMTTSAIVGGFRICQARLGVKIHGEKDPAADLGPMFRQVVGTIFQLMETVPEAYWKQGQRAPEMSRPSGSYVGQEEPLPLRSTRTISSSISRPGMFNFSGVWQQDHRGAGHCEII